MFDYSVVTPVADREQVFYIVPLAEEDRFVDVDGNATGFEFARLDLMLEILNGYQLMPHGSPAYETEHYHYSREVTDKGMLAKVTARK